ncbi:MAG: hypothetical protein IT237_06615 [Bacteroidia bacterium]|nr:hypothetical protein [Bacteroidia bacterium]
MIVYLTYNDAPSGIFSSQVIDVVRFLNAECKANVRLVSFISVRGFFSNRNKIKEALPKALVLPMFPGVHRWQWNQVVLRLLFFLWKPKIIIALSVLATQLAMKVKNKSTKMVYDGRGAIAAEWHEYQVVNHPMLLNSIFELEKQCVLNADFRIAVSQQLIKHWKEVFNYESNKHVVIPCTLSSQFESVKLDEISIQQKRAEYGLNSDDVVMVYSGSVAGWQSFTLLLNFIKPILSSGQQFKMIFFSDASKQIEELIHQFPEQVKWVHLSSEKVAENLIIGDYGLLIREETVTNRVASPVKLAEYLACGLKVVISNHLGDYTDFILQTNSGFLFQNILTQQLKQVSFQDKIQLQHNVIHKVSKKTYLSEYYQILEPASLN